MLVKKRSGALIEYQDELETWKQVCFTSMHIGRAPETFETILSFKMCRRLEDVEPELDTCSCWLMTTREQHILRRTTDDIEIATLVRSLPPASWIQVTKTVMRNMTTRQTIPLNVRHAESDGIEPTPM